MRNCRRRCLFGRAGSISGHPAAGETSGAATRPEPVPPRRARGSTGGLETFDNPQAAITLASVDSVWLATVSVPVVAGLTVEQA